jgi:hypothetical protein
LLSCKLIPEPHFAGRKLGEAFATALESKRQGG